MGEPLKAPAKPRGAGSVMASRIEAADSLDYFPTPPWATRAVLPFLRSLDPALGARECWEPAAGEGHMAGVLTEGFGSVYASDVFDYGYAHVHDFLDGDSQPVFAEAWESLGRPDWVVTNPPFKTAVEFALRGLERARVGVALLVRTAWLEGGDRHDRLFSERPPALIVQYAERMPMTKGRWDPAASTATSYCWVIWLRETGGLRRDTRFAWIPPGQRKALSRPEDLRFAVQADGALL